MFASGLGFPRYELCYFLLRIYPFGYQILPFIIPATYFFILPRPDQFSPGVVDEDEANGAPLSASYTRLPNEEDISGHVPFTDSEATTATPVALSLQDKWSLAKPMFMRYMLPLCKSFAIRPGPNTHVPPLVCVYMVRYPHHLQ